MPRTGEPARLIESSSAAFRSDAAVQRIDAACRQAVAGKLALRDLAAWLRGHGATEGEFRLLWLLYHGEGHGACRRRAFDQARLAEQLVVSPAQVSGMVERLRSAALIDRVRDGADRRRQLWRLAAAGDALVRAVVASVEAGDFEAVTAERQEAA
jgi:DNA-binding MarR family transcriptional regulator